jgi:uncharacterized membrane protein YkvA (DUF1232 family)
MPLRRSAHDDALLAWREGYTHIDAMTDTPDQIDDAKIGEILAPVSAERTRRRQERVRERFWGTMKRAAAHIPFAEDVAAAYYCALDPRTPFRVRGTLMAALAYFVLPFDIVPDFIFGIGFTDDIAVLTAAITAVQAHVKARHRKQAREALGKMSGR